MTILLAALGVAFAAFCVWLGVRVYNRRERWAKWTAVGLATVIVAYPLSYGPAIWVFYRLGAPLWVATAIQVFYYPLWVVLSNGPAFLGDIAEWYVHLWNPDLTVL